jgi:hypothetical protein
VQNALSFEDRSQWAKGGAIRLYVGSHISKRGVFVHGKAGTTFEFIEIVCNLSKTAIIFISTVALFILR